MEYDASQQTQATKQVDEKVAEARAYGRWLAA
jgi:hypothetical protein